MSSITSASVLKVDKYSLSLEAWDSDTFSERPVYNNYKGTKLKLNQSPLYQSKEWNDLYLIIMTTV